MGLECVASTPIVGDDNFGSVDIEIKPDAKFFRINRRRFLQYPNSDSNIKGIRELPENVGEAVVDYQKRGGTVQYDVYFGNKKKSPDFTF